METVTLTIKKKWFDLIASGEKTEEYRELNMYYLRRLIDTSNFPAKRREDILNSIGEDLQKGLDMYVKSAALRHNCKIKYNGLMLRNGYSKNAPKIITGVIMMTYEFGKPEWGAPTDKRVLVFHLGTVTKIINT